MKAEKKGNKKTKLKHVCMYIIICVDASAQIAYEAVSNFNSS